MPTTECKIKIGTNIRLDKPKKVIFHQGKPPNLQGLILPKFLLVAYGVGKDYIVFKVAKMQLKKDIVKHGDLVRISNTSLIHLKFKTL